MMDGDPELLKSAARMCVFGKFDHFAQLVRAFPAVVLRTIQTPLERRIERFVIQT
jgi:hypothetical protein